MLADAGKKLTPLVCAGSTKEAACAYKNALMKRVFVHESMGKFIKKVREDGQVELHVIEGDVADSEFGRYGSTPTPNPSPNSNPCPTPKATWPTLSSAGTARPSLTSSTPNPIPNPSPNPNPNPNLTLTLI